MTVLVQAMPELVDRALLAWICWYLIAYACSLPMLIAQALTGKKWL